MHIFKTKDQSEKGGQLQGWDLNLTRMQLNRFLKSKLQLWTWLNKLKTENWFGNRHFLAPFLFKWNGMFCTNPVVSFTVHIKKRPKTVSFWNNIVYLLLPLTRKDRERRFFFFSFAASFSLSPSYLSKNPDTTHTPSWPTTMMKEAEGPCEQLRGDYTEATPATLSLCHDWTGVE